MEERAHFFISYARPDLAKAEATVRHLEALGYRTILDKERFTPGRILAAEIDHALSSAHCTILLLSPAYFQSRYTHAEWTAAWNLDPDGKQGRLWPIRLEKMEVPSQSLGARIYTDLVDGDENAVRAKLSEGAGAIRLLWPASMEARAGMSSSSKPDLLDGSAIPARSAHLPPHSRILLKAPPNTFGRQNTLRKIASFLAVGKGSDQGRVLTVVLTGGHGMGKTQLASEFVFRYGSFFEGGVFWLRFGDSSLIRDEIADCGRVLQLSPNPRDQLAEEVRLLWKGSKTRLLVFDNCEEPSLMEEFRPPHGGCRVLVTSRFSDWPQLYGIEEIHVGELEADDCIQMLRSYPLLNRMNEKDLLRISEELGYAPLALHLAGSFLSRYREDAREFLTQIRKGIADHPSMHGKGANTSPTNHDNNVIIPFQKTLARLSTAESTDELATKLLSRAGFLAPGEPIPDNLLLATVGLDAAPAESRRDAFDAIARLSSVGLMHPVGNSFVVHRLIARLARESADPGEQEEAVEHAILKRLREYNQIDLPLSSEFLTHSRFVTDRAMQRRDLRAAGLCHSFGYVLMGSESPADARPYFEQALSIWQQNGEESEIAQGHHNLGELLSRQGDSAAALHHYRLALEARKKLLPSDHPEIALSLNNLGLILKKQGQLALAKSHYAMALELRERILGSHHIDVAESLQNLGVLSREMGDLRAAKEYYERALSIRESILGQDHPDVAQSVLSLGALYLSSGDLAPARQSIERAVNLRENIYGPRHQDTARGQIWMGYLLQKEGDHQKAQEYYRQACETFEVTLGPDAEETRRARQYYAAAVPPSTF